MLHTKEEYGDFVARLEFKLPPGGNNGLAIRYPGEGRRRLRRHVRAAGARRPSTTKYAGIDPRQAHGSAYGMVAGRTAATCGPAGEWNFQEVTVKGSTIKVELNGSRHPRRRPVARSPSSWATRRIPARTARSGYFGFAGHSDPVEFRNVEIQGLAAE